MGRRLFVGNLSYDTSDQDLKDMFARAGTCDSASVVRDRMTGRSRGFGFVEMSSDEEAQRAVATLNNQELQGRNISVSEARERTAGPRPPSFGGQRNFGPPAEPPDHRFRKEGGSRRGVRARKRSL
ncbi:MAG TPA: RNA-binding protein [Patescibacteria group bacterium]|jgi:RNA recognition motif-containing protein|nr:RNA-binding protein [Patescibacteria group bacterium]